MAHRGLIAQSVHAPENMTNTQSVPMKISLIYGTDL